MSLTRTETGVEPVSLEEARLQCYLGSLDSDSRSLLNAYIKSARLYAENRTWRTFKDSTYTWKLDDFPSGTIEVLKPPLVGITSIKYYTNETLTTLSTDDYRVDTSSEPGRIEPIDYWPGVDDRIDAVEITFTGGYGDSGNQSTVPEDVKIAMRMYIKYLYDNRDSHVLLDRSGEYHEAPIGTNTLLDQYSVRTP